MKEPLSTSELLHVIGLIYDAATDPGKWPTALEAIRRSLGFANTALALLTFPLGRSLINVTTNISPAYDSKLGDYGPDITAMWGGWEALRTYPLDQPILLSRVNPRAARLEATSNRYVREWRKPQKLIDTLVMQLPMDESGFGSLGMARHRDAGPVGELEIETARLLMPHLQRAVATNRLLDICGIVRCAFDVLATPVLVMTPEMRLIHANPPAGRLLTDGALLRLHKDMVMAASPGTSLAGALPAAVARAARGEGSDDRRRSGIPAWRKDGSAVALYVLPLRSHRILATSPEAVAIFVVEADTSRMAAMELIVTLFGLTAAEARVFELIAAGHTVAEASEKLALKPSTVRTHILRIFGKTGMRRQSEIVQLAISLAAPVAA